MKKIAILFLAVIIPSVLSAGMTKEQKLDAGYILKSITIPEGSDRARVSVDTVIDASPKAVWDALVDINRWPGWLPMTKKAEFLSDAAANLVSAEIAKNRGEVIAIKEKYPAQESEGAPAGDHWSRVAYEEYDLPWPIKNEWVVRKYTYYIHKDYSRASWKRVDSQREENDGSWQVGLWKDGRTHIVYNYNVKPKEKVPEVVFKTAVSMTVNSMMKALRHEAMRRDVNMVRYSKESGDILDN